MDIGDAIALFPGDEVAVAMPGDLEVPSVAVTNGGFTTGTIDGPDAMALHRNMYFIIEAGNASYQYFNVDIATLTQD
jgi:hypothetical protein